MNPTRPLKRGVRRQLIRKPEIRDKCFANAPLGTFLIELLRPSNTSGCRTARRQG